MKDLIAYIQDVNREFGITKTLRPPSFDGVEEKKLRRRDKVKSGAIMEVPRVRKIVSCLTCGGRFEEENWHTPPDCPWCH